MEEIKKLNFINADKVDDKTLAAAKLLVEKKLTKKDKKIKKSIDILRISQYNRIAYEFLQVIFAKN